MADLKATLKLVGGGITGVKSVLLKRLMDMIEVAIDMDDTKTYEAIRDAAEKHLVGSRAFLHSVCEMPIELTLEDCHTSLIFPVVEMTLMPCPFHKILATLTDCWIQTFAKYKRISRKFSISIASLDYLTKYMKF